MKVCWMGLCWAVPVLLHAQGLRDPMQMPGSLRAPSGTSTSHGMGSSHAEPTIAEGAPLHRFDDRCRSYASTVNCSWWWAPV